MWHMAYNGLWFILCALTQVHVRTKPCYGRRDVSCNCAVAMREGNHVLGVYACDPGLPPVAIRYLDDPLVPGASIRITPSGRTYTVSEEFRQICLKSISVFWS